MKIRTFPGEGYMSVETTPQELREIANNLEQGDVTVEQDIPGNMVLRVKLDSSVQGREEASIQEREKCRQLGHYFGGQQPVQDWEPGEATCIRCGATKASDGKGTITIRGRTD